MIELPATDGTFVEGLVASSHTVSEKIAIFWSRNATISHFRDQRRHGRNHRGIVPLSFIHSDKINTLSAYNVIVLVIQLCLFFRKTVFFIKHTNYDKV